MFSLWFRRITPILMILIGILVQTNSAYACVEASVDPVTLGCEIAAWGLA